MELLEVVGAVGDGDAGVLGVWGEVFEEYKFDILEAALRRTSRIGWQISISNHRRQSLPKQEIQGQRSPSKSTISV